MSTGAAQHGQDGGSGVPLLPVEAVPARYPGRWASAIACLVVVALLARAFIESPHIQWSAVAEYLTAEAVLNGLWLTIVLTFAAQAIGIVGGIILATMTISPNPVLKAVSGAYIWLFRGTPALIQIIFWFNIGLIFPDIFLGIPWTEIGIRVETNVVITPLIAAVIALGLNEAAYMSEIVRAGIISIDRGQSEAAAAIGLTHRQSMRYVILPQAVRTIIPPTGNELIGMLKNTSLVSVISAQELLTSVQQIYAMNFLTIELLIVASIWYLVMTTIATVAQGYLERFFDRGARRPQRAGPASLLRGLFGRTVSSGRIDRGAHG